MTVTKTMTGGGSQGPERAFQSTLTAKDASQIGYSKDEYAEAAQHVRLIVSEHIRLDTRREAWEPQLIHGEHIAARFIENGEDVLDERLESEADTLLVDAQKCNERAKGSLDELAERREPLVTPESGATYGVPEASKRVRKCDDMIELGERAGLHYHRRTPSWLKKIAPWAPWLELAGFLFFVAYFLDVPLLQPWLDFGAWSLSIAIVASTILGQTWLVHHGAWSHNHGREAYAEDNRDAGEKAFRRRNWYLAFSALTVTTAITIGMVLRGLTTLADADIATKAFMIFVAVVAGVIMPTLFYLAIALDGSKISRERDSLAAQLDDDLVHYNATIMDCRHDLHEVAKHRKTLRKMIFPDVCNDVQRAVDGSYRLYGLVRLLIGGLAAEPPGKTTPTLTWNADGTFDGHIGTSIPGAHDVDLKPLRDRYERLAAIWRDRRELLEKVNALPPHPWGTART